MSHAKIRLSRNFPVSQSGKLATAAAMQLVNPDFRFDASGCVELNSANASSRSFSGKRQ
jgi:hypothetical protein